MNNLSLKATYILLTWSVCFLMEYILLCWWPWEYDPISRDILILIHISFQNLTVDIVVIVQKYLKHIIWMPVKVSLVSAEMLWVSLGPCKRHLLPILDLESIEQFNRKMYCSPIKNFGFSHASSHPPFPSVELKITMDAGRSGNSGQGLFSKVALPTDSEWVTDMHLLLSLYYTCSGII